jgi:hypothetical protein
MNVTIKDCDKSLQAFDIVLTINVSNIEEPIDNNTIFYIATGPPNYMSTYSGSGLPFHSKEQALFNTPNKGNVTLNTNKEAIIKLYYPNSYNEDVGNILVKPHVTLFYYSNSIIVEKKVILSKGIPFRSLSHPNIRNGPEFYSNNIPTQTQESILRLSQYPTTDLHYKNFWGGKPAK